MSQQNKKRVVVRVTYAGRQELNKALERLRVKQSVVCGLSLRLYHEAWKLERAGATFHERDADGAGEMQLRLPRPRLEVGTAEVSVESKTETIEFQVQGTVLAVLEAEGAAHGGADCSNVIRAALQLLFHLVRSCLLQGKTILVTTDLGEEVVFLDEERMQELAGNRGLAIAKAKRVKTTTSKASNMNEIKLSTDLLSDFLRLREECVRLIKADRAAGIKFIEAVVRVARERTAELPRLKSTASGSKAEIQLFGEQIGFALGNVMCLLDETVTLVDRRSRSLTVDTLSYARARRRLQEEYTELADSYFPADLRTEPALLSNREPVGAD